MWALEQQKTKHALKTVKASFAGVSALGEKTTYLHCSIIANKNTGPFPQEGCASWSRACSRADTPRLSTFGTPISERLPKQGAEPACTDTKAVRQPMARPLPATAGWGREGRGAGRRGPGGGERGCRARRCRRGAAEERAALPGSAAGPGRRPGGAGRWRGAARRSAPRGEGARRVRSLGAVSVTLPWGRRGLMVPGGGKGSPLPFSPVSSFAAPKRELKSSDLPLVPPPSVGCADQSH